MNAARSRSLADRLSAATSSGGDVEALARIVFGTIAVEVPFVFGCLATTDPANGLITRAIKSHPLDIGDEEFAAAEYGRPDLNQFAEIAHRREPVGVLSIDTGGDVRRCLRFRDYMIPTFGFTDELRLACRSQDATWGALALYRGPGQPAFTEADGRVLAGVHELLAQRLQHVLFSASQPDPAAGAAVLIVDGAGKVIDSTAAADRQVEDLGGWDNGCLPANLLALAVQTRATGRTAQTRVLGRSGRWLAVQALTLAGPDPSVVLSIGPAPASDIGQLALAARGLTNREQDVARLVLQGASTRAIAQGLHLSPHTVQDHLKAVFRKLGVTSRREMIAHLVLLDG